MDFRILGPLEVADGERLLPLGGGKQRALLAVLLLHRNEVVSTDRLIDDLWRDDPPATAAKIVQNSVSQLRRALLGAGQTGEAVLVTSGHGYALRVRPGELDVDRFEQLLDAGRRALATGAPEEARDRFRDALALWRGPALADFAFEDFAQGEIARLEERRLAAVEERIEADLALGRHADLVGELEALAARHPLRERVRAQLMLALYRSGRQSEALHVYGEARRTLVEELGIAPGPALQSLESAILRQDAALEPAAPRAAVPSPPARQPARLVTVMCADVDSSADMTGGRGDEIAQRLLEGRRRVQTELERHGGSRVDSIERGLLATFLSTRSAIACAVSMRRVLEHENPDGEVQVRIALNLGEVSESGGHPFGAAIAAERVVTSAAPGDILVTEAVRHLAGTVAGVAFRDRGRVTLPGFAEPWRLYEVVAEGAAPASATVAG